MRSRGPSAPSQTSWTTPPLRSASSPDSANIHWDFTVGYHVSTFVDQYRVQDELRKRLLRRLRREGIGLAVPARRIHLSTNDGSAVYGGDGRQVVEGRSAE